MKELVLMNKNETYGEVLGGVDYTSFYYSNDVNDERMIEFDIYRFSDSADIFDNLKNETIIIYDNQKYIVKSTKLEQLPKTIKNSVEAKHVSLDFQKHYVPERISEKNENEDDDSENEDDSNNSGGIDPRNVDSRWIDLSKGINFPFDPNGTNPDYPFDTVHNGVDLAYYNEPVYSVIKGQASTQFEDNGFGNYVRINAGKGIEVIYAHLSEFTISDGQKVLPGDQLGISGNTGKSTGPHLHFEVRKDGISIDPIKWLKDYSAKQNLSEDEINLSDGAGGQDDAPSDVDVDIDDDYSDDEDISDNPKFTLKQYLDFIFKDNDLGYKYEIVGDFPQKRAFKKLGGQNGMKLLQEAADTFGFIYKADNKKFYIYDESNYYEMSEEPIVYQYNNDEITVETKTHEIETYIKGYGEKIPDRETKNYDPLKPDDLNYSGKFEKEGTWYTTQVGAYYYKQINAKWGNETLEWSLKKQSKGGMVRVYFDNEQVDDYSCYSENAETEKIVIADNIKKGKHDIRIEFLGKNNEINYDKDEPRMYVGTEKSTILNITANLKGEDVYRVVAEYKSPNFEAFGGKKLRASDVHDKDATTREELLRTLVSTIKDEPELTVSANYKGLEKLKENNKVRLIHKPLGINVDLKITKMKIPHPYSMETAEITFTNSQTDILRLQRNYINDIQNFNTNDFDDEKEMQRQREENKARENYSDIVGVSVIGNYLQ